MTKTCLYALIDPRDFSVRYIGYTGSLDLQKRLKGHLLDKGNTPKIDWINKLKRLGLKPCIKFLRFATIEQEAEEISWWKSSGAKLTNYLPGGEHGPILKGIKQKPEHIKNAGLAKRKTTKEQDEYIRKSYLSGEKKMVELSKEFGLSVPTIIRVVYGRINSFEKKNDIEKRVKNVRFTEKEIINIKEMINSGKSYTEIAKIYKKDPSVISRLANGKNYKGIGKENIVSKKEIYKNGGGLLRSVTTKAAL